MLHTEVVAESTLELLKSLQSDEALASFCLAGGTSLALYLGHRVSVDLDLFTPKTFDAVKLSAYLEKKYGFRTGFLEENTLKGDIAGVKIDCITHAYKSIRPPFVEDGIRLYDMADVIAMKLSAIADNGSRIKDFVDIACLSVFYSFSDMLGFYERKFPTANAIRPLKAMTYFEDIDFTENIMMLEGDFKWSLVEKRLNGMVANPEKIYKTLPI